MSRPSLHAAAAANVDQGLCYTTLQAAPQRVIHPDIEKTRSDGPELAEIQSTLRAATARLPEVVAELSVRCCPLLTVQTARKKEANQE